MSLKIRILLWYNASRAAFGMPSRSLDDIKKLDDKRRSEGSSTSPKKRTLDNFNLSDKAFKFSSSGPCPKNNLKH